MTKPQFFTPKFIENALHFGVYFLVLTVVPLIGRLLAPLWNWVCYGMLFDLFVEIHTALIWAVLAPVFAQIERRRKKRYPERKVFLVASGDEMEEAARLLERKEKAPLLPIKNVGILTAICAGCILLISAIVGFEVKPFYDLARRGSGYALWCGVGVLGCNIFQCMWITALLGTCRNMADEIVRTCFPNKKEWFGVLLTGAMLMAYGLVDVFAFVADYPMGGRELFIALAYVLFYAVFPIIFYFTKENRYKSYFLIVLIYIF